MVMQVGKRHQPASERVWREQLNELVSAESSRVLVRQSLPDTVCAIAVLWIEVAVLLAAANLLPRLPLAWAIPPGIVLVLLMGLRMNAFGVILHEGSHGLLARSRKLNDRMCNWAHRPSGRSTRSRSTGPPTGSTTATWARRTILTVSSIWCPPGVGR